MTTEDDETVLKQLYEIVEKVEAVIDLENEARCRVQKERDKVREDQRTLELLRG